MQPILSALSRRGLRVAEVKYGSYRLEDYRNLLRRARSMLFLSSHESQGLAYQECLSCDVPVLAWDQGWCLDPNRFEWGTPNIPASSVPYFDFRCGEKFQDMKEFEVQLDRFLERLSCGEFQPRAFIMENLTLEKCARDFLRFFRQTANLE